MRTDGWFDSWRARLIRLIGACCLLAFSMSVRAQTIGNSFWYDPSHDKWVATDFYKSPALNAPKIHIEKKMRLMIVTAKQGWFAIRAEASPGNASLVFIPIRMFRFRLYRPDGAGGTNAAFQRSSIFEIDPDIVQRQLEGKGQESKEIVKTKPTGKLKPWQKYKENWGNLTPPAKKNKYLLLDDIKQPEGTPEPPETPETPP